MFKQVEKLEEVAMLLKAIAHPVRLGVIHLLAENKELSVSQMTVALGREQATVSQHLQKMKLFGLLGTRREGKFVQYFLKEQKLIEILRMMEQLIG